MIICERWLICLTIITSTILSYFLGTSNGGNVRTQPVCQGKLSSYFASVFNFVFVLAVKVSYCFTW